MSRLRLLGWILLTFSLTCCTQAQKRSWRRSCYLSGVKPYPYPLPRPAKPGGAPITPNWQHGQERPFLRGISLGMYFQDPSYDYEQFLVDIARTGASHVSLVVSWYQKNVRSVHLGRHKTKTVTDQRLIKTIMQARSRGLQVMLLPIVRLRERGPDDWRGVIKPDNMDRWWKSYRAYILHYAQLARQTGVEIFTVGSELVSMERLRPRWRRLIRDVRRLFPGPLIYSANWDHYKPVTFWDLLDYIGISSYYELSKKNNPPLRLLRRSWKKIRRRLEQWKKKYPKQPLVFTEAGYYSQLGTNIYPWDYTRNQPLSLQEQFRCYLAFAQVWRESKVLGGVFFWNWFGKGGPQDKTYTPRGKPAECVIRQWFAEIRQREKASPRSPRRRRSPQRGGPPPFLRRPQPASRSKGSLSRKATQAASRTSQPASRHIRPASRSL